MAKYVINKENTTTNVKNAVRKEVMDVVIEALKSTYGEENVFFVRTGTATSPKTELAVVTGYAEVDGAEVPVCATVNASAKDAVRREGNKRSYEAFDVWEAKSKYEDYLVEKEEKEAAKKAAKAKKSED